MHTFRLIKLFDLELHADKFVKNLSSGTKRKLSFLISLIGRPKVLLLDGCNLTYNYTYNFKITNFFSI